MFCNKCGTEFIGVDICPGCGQPVTVIRPPKPEMQPIRQPNPAMMGKGVPVRQTAVKNEKSRSGKSDRVIFVLKIIICALGMALGILAILNIIVPGALFGVYVEDYYSWYKSVEFGADFYTEIHDAVSHCVRGIGNVNESVVGAANIVQLIAGSCFILGFGFKLLTVVENRKKKN